MEHAQRRTVLPTAPGFSETEARLLGDTSHDHLSALVGPNVAFTLSPSAIYDTTCLRRESRKLYLEVRRLALLLAPPRRGLPPPPDAGGGYWVALGRKGE